MVEKITDALRQQSDEAPSTSAGNSEAEDDEFFGAVVTQPEDSRKQTSLRNRAQSLVKTCLESKSKDFLNNAAFSYEQVLMSLFVQYNTSIPSSVAVKRLFSTGKDILRAKRSLSDEKFNLTLT